jgi:hypothetical protein
VKREEPMCDELTEKDNDEYLRKNKLTRRKFGQHGVAAAVAMMLPPVANAVDVVEQDVTVDTPDGEADCLLPHTQRCRGAGGQDVPRSGNTRIVDAACADIVTGNLHY